MNNGISRHLSLSYIYFINFKDPSMHHQKIKYLILWKTQ